MKSPTSITIRMGALALLLASSLEAQGTTAAFDKVPTAVGHVRFDQKISQTAGGFTGTLRDEGGFGFSAVALGDLDADGIVELAVSAPGSASTAVWILFLNADGTVKTFQEISETEGGFEGDLGGAGLGDGLAALGDLDGDGVGDLAVGSRLDSDGGPGRGAVWILFLHPNGTVKTHQKISDLEGAFLGDLEDLDSFGSAVTSLGDLDRDGNLDLAVAAVGDDDGGDAHGAVWVLFLDADGTVGGFQKISDTEGSFTGTLDDSDFFGRSLTSVGDLDCDGNADLVVGAAGDDGGFRRGAAWVLFLSRHGTVRLHTKISDTSGGFAGLLEDEDDLGAGVAFLGDLDGDGNADLGVGAIGDDDGGSNRGAVWMLFLDGNGCFGEDTLHLFSDGFESGDTAAWSETHS